MNNIDDEFRCDCIAMTRAIKDEIDAEFANMTSAEIIEHLKNVSIEFSKQFPPKNKIEFIENSQ